MTIALIRNGLDPAFSIEELTREQIEGYVNDEGFEEVINDDVEDVSMMSTEQKALPEDNQSDSQLLESGDREDEKEEGPSDEEPS